MRDIRVPLHATSVVWVASVCAVAYLWDAYAATMYMAGSMTLATVGRFFTPESVLPYVRGKYVDTAIFAFFATGLFILSPWADMRMLS
ncbi:hypothetical protein I6E29_09315 [Arcanobacterium haemolyticum]|nr:hypothetical protein [Arcanobacterium haemolyticum]